MKLSEVRAGGILKYTGVRYIKTNQISSDQTKAFVVNTSTGAVLMLLLDTEVEAYESPRLVS